MTMDLSLIDKQVVYDGTKVRLEVHHLQTLEGERFKKEITQVTGKTVHIADPGLVLDFGLSPF